MLSTPSLEKLKAPLFLRDLPIWLCWRYEGKAGSKKPLKIPYYAKGGRRKGVQGSPEDIANLVTFEVAKRAAIRDGHTGVGLCPLKKYDLTILDFDNCIDNNGKIDNSVEDITLGTYSELSPSGRGIHSFVHGLLGNNKSPTKDNQFGFELFSTKGFVTFTGHHTELCDLTNSINSLGEPSDKLLKLIDERFGHHDVKQQEILPFSPPVTQSVSPLHLSWKEISGALSFLDPNCGYDEWLRIGLALHHETGGSQNGFNLWDSWSANSADKYTSEAHNLSKWQSFNTQSTNKPVTGRYLLKLAFSKGYQSDTNPCILDTDFQVLTSQSEVGIELKNPRRIFSNKEALQTAVTGKWLLKNFLPKANVGFLYGPSGSGKSFLAVDICASICRGLDWNGYKCPKESKVLYIAAEDPSGYFEKIKAYSLSKELSGGRSILDMDNITTYIPNFFDKSSIVDLITDIQEAGSYDLIVIDTLNRAAIGAEENSAKDMGLVIEAAQKVSQTCGGMVLIVHHTGKDVGKGMRGSTALLGGADVMIEVSCEGEERSARITKIRKGKLGARIDFVLRPVVLGLDEDGDEDFSCVIDYKKEVSLTLSQQEFDKLFQTINQGKGTDIDTLLSAWRALKMQNGEKDIKGNIKQNAKNRILKPLLEIGHFVDDMGVIKYPSKTNEGY